MKFLEIMEQQQEEMSEDLAPSWNVFVLTVSSFSGGRQLGFRRYSPLHVGLSPPTPMAFKPLSTQITEPVMADAKGDAKKAAAFPTSSADNGFCRGAFASE